MRHFLADWLMSNNVFGFDASAANRSSSGGTVFIKFSTLLFLVFKEHSSNIFLGLPDEVEGLDDLLSVTYVGNLKGDSSHSLYLIRNRSFVLLQFCHFLSINNTNKWPNFFKFS